MLLNRIFLLLLLGIGLASPALTTVDVLHANNINKKLYYFEEGSYVGFGWVPMEVDPSKYEREEARYLEADYAFTDTPYELEYSGVIALLFALAVFWFIRRGINLLRRF